MKKTINISGLFFLSAMAGWASAVEESGILWMSEIAPPKQQATKREENQQSTHANHALPQSAVSSSGTPSSSAGKKHDHDNQIILDEAPGKDHRPGKQLWLRMGDDIKKAPFVRIDDGEAVLTVIDRQGRRSEMVAGSGDGWLTAKSELPEIGFYNVYFASRSLRDGKMIVALPKVELLWASCSAKEVDEEAVAKPIINESSPLELVREHQKDEGCMARIVSGDVVNFQVLSYGKPVAGVPVSMVTQEGWRNTLVSDDAGRVAFTMIREYYPNWLEFKKYHTDTFLITAELERAESGKLGGKRYSSTQYVATLPGKYRPSPYDYRSYAWGLGISLFVIVSGGLAVYLYRRRRLKPYQEERVDDKA
jgi:hypothetical protein